MGQAFVRYSAATWQTQWKKLI